MPVKTPLQSVTRLFIYLVLAVGQTVQHYKGREPRTDLDWFWAAVDITLAMFIVFRAFIDSSHADSQNKEPVQVEGSTDPASPPVKVEEE